VLIKMYEQQIGEYVNNHSSLAVNVMDACSYSNPTSLDEASIDSTCDYESYKYGLGSLQRSVFPVQCSTPNLRLNRTVVESEDLLMAWKNMSFPEYKRLNESSELFTKMMVEEQMFLKAEISRYRKQLEQELEDERLIWKTQMRQMSQLFSEEKALHRSMDKEIMALKLALTQKLESDVASVDSLHHNISVSTYCSGCEQKLLGSPSIEGDHSDHNTT
jgi:hypothetical protein